MNCELSKCPAAFDDPRVKITGTPFATIEQDCSPEKGILFLTDEPGLLNIADPTLGPFLDADGTNTVSSFDEAGLHYTPCDKVYWDLRCFFSEPQENRPASIIIGLVDAGETLSQAFDRITACPVCACDVQVASCKADGTSWFDTAEYGTFTDEIDASDEWHHHATTNQASTAFTDMFETSSFAAGYSHQSQEWTVADYSTRFVYSVNSDGECEVEVDADGNEVCTRYYLNSGLTAAALDAAHTVDDANYNYTTNAANSTCHTGAFLDETTGTAGDINSYDEVPLGSYGNGGLVNLTGLTDGVGNPLTGASRHLSAFTLISNGKANSVRYFSSIYVNGENYGDVFYKKKAVDAAVRCAILAYKDTYGTNLTQAGQQAEALIIKGVLDQWISKGVINPDPYDWSGTANILINGKFGDGEGYVIGATPASQLNTTQINGRAASYMQYCFNVNTPQHGSCIQVCEVPVITEAN